MRQIILFINRREGKMKNKTFVVLTAVLFLTLMIFSPMRYLLTVCGIAGFTDLGNYFEPEHVYEGNSTADILLNSIEAGKVWIRDIYTNYTPFYASIVTTVRSEMLTLNKPFNQLLTSLAVRQKGAEAQKEKETVQELTDAPEPAETELTVMEPGGQSTYILEEGRHRLYTVTLDEPMVNSVTGETVEGFLDRAILVSHEELRKRVEHQAKELNRIAAINTDVNFYVYLGTRFQECEAYDTYFPLEKNTASERDLFLELLDDRIRYDYLEINSLQDRIDKIYLTDHHWNPFGAHCGYTDMIHMMAEDSPEIGVPLEYTSYHLVADCHYYGSTARASGSYEWQDSFFFYQYDLPAYTSKPKNDLPAKIEMYLNGKFDKTRGADHYQTLFTAKTKFETENPPNDRVLFILGDSFSYSTAYLLSTHFKTTYVMNPSTLSTDFKYSRFLERCGVTDVLVLLISDRLYGDVYNNTPLSNIVDE